MEAAVVHGKAMDIHFAGKSHKVEKDGVSVTVRTPLSKALLSCGLPINLGERRTVATLDVPWPFYHNGVEAADMPTFGFREKDLGEFAFPLRIGAELTVKDFEVLLTAKSATNPKLQV